MGVGVERQAFNLAFYTEGGNSARQKLGADLAALVLETAPRQNERITSFTFKVSEGKVVCPEFDGKADVGTLLRWETPADRLESAATLKIRDYILAQKAPFVVVWLSPPDEKLGYPEGRMVVGISREEKGIKMVENYGICLDYSSGDCLNLANRLLLFLGRDFLTCPDSLRANPIFIEPQTVEPPLDLVSRLLPLPGVWEEIKSGRAEELRQKALEDAQTVVGRVMSEIQGAEDQWQLVQIGALAEQQMRQLGWGMRSGSGCGLLNSELLGAISPFGSSHFHFEQGEALLLKQSETGVFVRKCPYCGVSVNRVINPGYQCNCGEVYRGVC